MLLLAPIASLQSVLLAKAFRCLALSDVRQNSFAVKRLFSILVTVGRHQANPEHNSFGCPPL